MNQAYLNRLNSFFGDTSLLILTSQRRSLATTKLELYLKDGLYIDRTCLGIIDQLRADKILK